MDRTTIIIADDHPIFREGLRQILEAESSFQILHVAENGKKALTQAEECTPAVMILDVSMPEMGGLEVAAEHQRLGLPFELVLLTMHDDKETFTHALDLGVKGYVLKDDASADIVRCVQAVVKGQTYVSSGVVHFLLESRDKGKEHAEDKGAPGLEMLTAAERRILRLVAQDKTSKEIASELGISPKTVDNHRGNMCGKLGLFGSHSLMRFALERRSDL